MLVGEFRKIPVKEGAKALCLDGLKHSVAQKAKAEHNPAHYEATAPCALLPAHCQGNIYQGRPAQQGFKGWSGSPERTGCNGGKSGPQGQIYGYGAPSSSSGSQREQGCSRKGDSAAEVPPRH